MFPVWFGAERNQGSQRSPTFLWPVLISLEVCRVPTVLQQCGCCSSFIVRKHQADWPQQSVVDRVRCWFDRDLDDELEPFSTQKLVMWENLFLLDLDELQRGWSLESGAVWGCNTGSTLSHTDLFCVVVYWRFGSFGHNTFKSHFRNSKSLLYRWLTYIDTQCILNGALSLDKKGIKGPNSNHRLTGLHVVQKVHS